jgi:hypothetical protein
MGRQPLKLDGNGGTQQEPTDGDRPRYRLLGTDRLLALANRRQRGGLMRMGKLAVGLLAKEPAVGPKGGGGW